jgi:hypothetical protein
MLCTSHLLRLSHGILRKCRRASPVPPYVLYLLLKLTTVLPPYQSVRTNTLHEHQFHRQQSVGTGEFSVLFNHEAEHMSLWSRYLAYKIALHIAVDLVVFPTRLE